MLSRPSFVKPRLRPAVGTPWSYLTTAGILGPFLASSFDLLPAEHSDLALWLVGISFAVLVVATRRSSKRNPARADPLAVVLDEGILRQFDQNGEELCHVDLETPFQYRILGSTADPNPEILLFQGERTFRFFQSDPGAAELIPVVLQIRWPRRPRFAASRTL